MRTAGIMGLTFAIAMIAAPVRGQNGATEISATLSGDQEVPLVSTQAQGKFHATIDEINMEVRYELSYSGLATTVRQAHIHFAQPFASGNIMVWLCDNPATNPAPAPVDVPECPQGGGMVTGTIRPADVGTGSGSQGIGTGEFAEFVAALRSGNSYVNVHTTQSQPGEIRGQIKPGQGPK
jgi:hypothetical protein